MKMLLLLTNVLLLLMITASCDHSSNRVQPEVKTLTIDEALSWRSAYGDLVGKPREAALERYGPTSKEKGQTDLIWNASPKTEGRMVNVIVYNTQNGPTVMMVKVFAKEDEFLDPIEVLKKAR
jgi:hypothetical protein